MIIDKKDIYTRFAKYTVVEMNCPICESDNYKTWGTCLKRETVYQPEVPELMTQYVKCKHVLCCMQGTQSSDIVSMRQHLKLTGESKGWVALCRKNRKEFHLTWK